MILGSLLPGIHSVRKKPLIIFLSVVVVVFAILIIIPRPTQPTTNNLPPTTNHPQPTTGSQFNSLLSPQPTPLPQTSSLPFSTQKSHLIKNLPYKTANFTIEYDPIANRFYISIFTEPYNTYNRQAQNFLKQYVTNPSQLNIKSAYFPPSPSP